MTAGVIPFAFMAVITVVPCMTLFMVFVFMAIQCISQIHPAQVS